MIRIGVTGVGVDEIASMVLKFDLTLCIGQQHEQSATMTATSVGLLAVESKFR